MNEKHEGLSDSKHHSPAKSGAAQSVDWYAPGQVRVFDVEGVRIVVRFVGRRGRRGRISITGLAKANFFNANDKDLRAPCSTGDKERYPLARTESGERKMDFAALEESAQL